MKQRQHIYRQIAVAKDQATISGKKSRDKKQEGDEQASFVYSVRAKALRLLVTNLYAGINRSKQKEQSKAAKAQKRK